MTENKFDTKLYDSIRQSIENVTPPPFYRVLQKTAENPPIESYEEIFGYEPKKKNNRKMSVVKMAGIAAIVTLFVGLSSVMGLTVLYIGSSQKEESAMDYNAEYSMNDECSQDIEDDNSSAGTSENVSCSDIANNVSSQL